MRRMFCVQVDVDIKIRACQGSCASTLAFRLQEEDYPDLSPPPPPPPPRREILDITNTAPQGQSKRLRLFGDIEENKLVIHTPHPHPEHPDL